MPHIRVCRLVHVRAYIYMIVNTAYRLNKRDHLCTTTKQDIYIEEARHQSAMMAIESSVLGCGSDDWSVDSDYAFQDFADDNLQQQKSTDQDLQSSPERAHLGAQTSATPATATTVVGVGGVPSLSAAGSNPEDEVERVNHHAASLYKEPSSGEAVATLDSGEEARLCEGVGAAVGIKRVDHAGVGREEHAACEARPFGDPGSSTDSAHILRLEQRMFLKVINKSVGVI